MTLGRFFLIVLLICGGYQYWHSHKVRAPAVGVAASMDHEWNAYGYRIVPLEKFDFDARVLAARGSGDGTIRLFDVAKGAELRQIVLRPGTAPAANGVIILGGATRPARGTGPGLAFSPDGSILVANGPGNEALSSTLVIIDAVARLIPGVLGDERSAVEESFDEGLLDWPHYTRPVEFEGRTVPEVLQGGHHADIQRWRLKQAVVRTWLRRPDLIARGALPADAAKLLEEFLAEREGDRHG